MPVGRVRDQLAEVFDGVFGDFNHGIEWNIAHFTPDGSSDLREMTRCANASRLRAMGRIALLPETVASQVAAGEVIERPASVVKELVENSLDAGATRITVTVHRGGVGLIRVTDDGGGMDREDALLCLERHATSKLRTGRDLAAVATMGFRGEALPSIASVSRFRLTTRESGALAGTEVAVNGGKIETVRDSGEAPGTQVEVRSLFYNLPARRKFLRSEATENGHIEAMMHQLAIGNPRVGFTFVRDERSVFQLPPAARLEDRIRDLGGTATLEELIEIDGTGDGAGRPAIRGFIGKAGVSRGSRAEQRVFVNGRAVENSTVHHALREGYHNALMKGRHPVTFLFLEMSPGAVDVNVHPAKREVRFHRPSDVHEAIVSAVRRSLESARAAWSRGFHQPDLAAATVPQAIAPDVASLFGADGTSQPAITMSVPMAPSRGETEASSPENIAPRPGPFRILGVLNRLYILMEGEGGLVLVDQHAAHERILFEELRRRLEAGDVLSQKLLLPVTIDVGPRDAEWLRRNLPDLQRMGLGLESFGPGTFKLESLPPYLPADQPQQLIREVIEELQAAGADVPRLRLGEEMIAKTVCRHAVKANDNLRAAEIEKLISNLLACELPYCCPHGRPTMIQVSHAELEKKFGRKT